MADETPRDPRLGRRMMVLRVAGLGAAAGAVASTAEAAPPAMPLQAPAAVVPVQRGSDNDPNDAPGRGIRR